jgi:hypothetical protein
MVGVLFLVDLWSSRAFRWPTVWVGRVWTAFVLAFRMLMLAEVVVSRRQRRFLL